MSDLFAHHDHLVTVATEDARFLKEKDRSYGASWKLAGGRSAWHMLRRKMDRMIAMMGRPEAPQNFSVEGIRSVLDHEHTFDAATARHLLASYLAEDIFAKIEERPGGEDGSVLAEVRDLRRYLLLVEAEMIARGVVARPVPPKYEVDYARAVFSPPVAITDILMVPHNDADRAGPPRPRADGQERPFGYDAAED